MKVIAGPGEGQPGDECDTDNCIGDAVCSGGHCTCDAGFRLDKNGVCGKKIKDLHRVCAFVARILQQESYIINYGITTEVIILFC